MSGKSAAAAATPAQIKTGETALSSPEKAAIIITALPEDEASSLLQQLGPAHVRAYVVATRRLRHVPAPVLEKVIVEFLDSLENNDLTLGPDTAQEILLRIMSPDVVSKIVGEATGVKQSVWQRAKELPDDVLAAFIESEHPRAASILMGRLPPEKAATVIAALNVDAAEQVIAMLKNPGEVDARVLSMVEESVEAALLENAEAGEPPDVFVGAVFDNMSEQTREPLMKSLEAKTPDFAKAVARRMFLFDDIPVRLGQRDVPALTRELDQSVIAEALAFASARQSEAVEYILSSIPKRMAEQIRESIEEMGSISADVGEAAEGEVIRCIRRLSNDGEITLKIPAE